MQISSAISLALALLALAHITGSVNGESESLSCCGPGEFCCGTECRPSALRAASACEKTNDGHGCCNSPPPVPDECCPPELPDCCGGICTKDGNGCGIIPGDCKHLCEPTDPCEQEPKVMGPCEAAIPSWSYIIETGDCEHFLYGGCEGTANRFESEAECKETCNVVVEDCCPKGEFCCDTACLPDGTQTLVPCGPLLCKCDDGPCICPTVFEPVCDPSTGTTYGNKCEAACDGVDPGVLEEGECDSSCVCPAVFDPVCDPSTGTTYANTCEAKCAGVGPVVEGECKPDCNGECCPPATPYCRCGGCVYLENPDFPVLCAEGSPTSCCDNPKEPCGELIFAVN